MPARVDDDKILKRSRSTGSPRKLEFLFDKSHDPLFKKWSTRLYKQSYERSLQCLFFCCFFFLSHTTHNEDEMRRMHVEKIVMNYRRDPSLIFRHFRTRQLSRSTEGRQPSKKRWDIRQGMEWGARESNHLLDVENTSRMKWVFHLPRKNSPETHKVDLHLVDCTARLTSRALLPKPILPPGGCASERTYKRTYPAMATILARQVWH